MNPSARTYKNRKQALKSRLRRGTISSAEYGILLLEAKFKHAKNGGFVEQPINAAGVAERWLAANDLPFAGDCHPECVAATYPDCECECGGLNHGAAIGMKPSEVKPRAKRRQR